MMSIKSTAFDSFSHESCRSRVALQMVLWISALMPFPANTSTIVSSSSFLMVVWQTRKTEPSSISSTTDSASLRLPTTNAFPLHQPRDTDHLRMRAVADNNYRLPPALPASSTSLWIFATNGQVASTIRTPRLSACRKKSRVSP